MGAEVAKGEKIGSIRIKTYEPGAIKGWAKELGVSEGRVREAVEKVGPIVADVIKFIQN